MIKNPKLTFLFSFLLGGASLAGAPESAEAAQGCLAATIVAVMDYPANCGGKGAFLTSVSGGNWICTANDQQMRIVTAAFLAGKPLYYQLGAGDNDCNPDASYSVSKAPAYLYME